MIRTPFWRDAHFWSATAAVALGIAIRHAPPKVQPDLIDIYAALAAGGIIAARRRTDSELVFREVRTPGEEREPHDELQERV